MILVILSFSKASVSAASQSSKTVYSAGMIVYPMSYRYGTCFHAWAEYNSATRDILSNMRGIWIRSDWLTTSFMYSWKDEMKQMGIEVLGVIDSWTLNRQSFGLADWEQKIGSIVANASDVLAWEIWNEPNDPKYELGYIDSTPEHYFEMLKAAHNIIKNATNALIVGPATGATGNWTGWIQQLVALGALNYLDVVSIHLYYDTVSDNQKYLNQVRSIVGDKPIWITEIGKPSAITRTEQFQDNYLQTNFDPDTGLSADVLFWYELVDLDSSSSSTEGHFGLVRSDYTFKPSYYTFKSIIG